MLMMLIMMESFDRRRHFLVMYLLFVSGRKVLKVSRKGSAIHCSRFHWSFGKILCNLLSDNLRANGPDQMLPRTQLVSMTFGRSTRTERPSILLERFPTKKDRRSMWKYNLGTRALCVRYES